MRAIFFSFWNEKKVMSSSALQHLRLHKYTAAVETHDNAIERERFKTHDLQQKSSNMSHLETTFTISPVRILLLDY